MGVTHSATIEYGLSAKIATANRPIRAMDQTIAKPNMYEFEGDVPVSGVVSGS